MRVRHRYFAVSLSLLTLAVIGYCAATSPMTAQQRAPTPAISLEPLPVLPPGTDVRTIWLRLAPPAPKPAPAQVPLAFTGVTVVDVTDGRLHPKQTVVVDGTWIRRIGPARTVAVPKGATVADAAGKYLIPGLWDMHAHVDDPVGWYPFYLANGVIGLREMAPRFPHGADSFRVWQREVMAGTRTGPRGGRHYQLQRRRSLSPERDDRHPGAGAGPHRFAQSRRRSLHQVPPTRRSSTARIRSAPWPRGNSAASYCSTARSEPCRRRCGSGALMTVQRTSERVLQDQTWWCRGAALWNGQFRERAPTGRCHDRERPRQVPHPGLADMHMQPGESVDQSETVLILYL